MMVMGSMIGSGIFLVSASMSRDLQSPTYLIAAWIVTALLTIMAALNYGELAAALPKAGGQYVYLREAYGKLTGFLYGWTLFSVIQTGTIAAVAVAFARFSGVIFPFISEEKLFVIGTNWGISNAQLLAIAVIFILTFRNYLPLKSGARLQNIFTVSKIAALIALIIAGIYFIITSHSNANPSTLNSPTVHTDFSIGIFCAAMVGSIFSSDAWNNITFTAGEIENPGRNLPRALIIGTGSVLVIYIFINYIYVQALPFTSIQHAPSDRVGTLLMENINGNLGAKLMAILIMVSTFGCINGLCINGARVYYAMAKDSLFFKAAAKTNKHDSPSSALLFQAIWASVLTLSGSYGDLLDYVVFAVLVFYILTVAAVIILRKKQASLNRPYQTIFYPFLPIAYIFLAAFICVCLLIYKPNYTYPGLIIVLAGIPVYFIAFRLKQKREI